MTTRTYKINERINLKLEHGKTHVYVNGDEVSLCKHIAVSIPVGELDSLQEIESIDDLEDKFYQKVNEEDEAYRIANQITPETEFMVHCSNIQAWAEHGYDTRLIHSSLAFPLLERLRKVGDQQAKKIFKEEIVKRYLDGNENVQKFLSKENYLNMLTPTEQNFLFKKNAQEIREIEKAMGHRVRIVGDVKLAPGIELIGGEIVGLQMTGKDLIYIPEQIKSFGSLKTLILDKFLDRKIPEWIGELTELKYLDLGYNRIETISENIGKLTNLKYLSLSNNNLKSLPKSISSLKNLEDIILNNNHFTGFPKELYALNKLWGISIAKNNIENIPSEIKYVRNLKEINLFDNPLKVLADELFNLPKLKLMIP